MIITDKHRLLVTGANGFVGNRLCELVLQKGWSVRRALRKGRCQNNVIIGDLTGNTDWSSALENIDVVIHLAARVHVMRDGVIDPFTVFHRVNVEATLNLARQAAAKNVKRLIFLSSIKVNGENTLLGKPYTAEDSPAPVDPYGISKYEAEMGLRKIALESQLEIVIIRPPMIYGAGVKANFFNMMSWLQRRIPLPLDSIHNKRSMIALDNIVDLILTCVEHPAAANETFLASDGEDLSTTELLQRMALAMGLEPRLFFVPAWFLQFLARVLGKGNVAGRLLGSLQVDIDKTKNLLNWTPLTGVDDALKKTAKDFLRKKNY